MKRLVLLFLASVLAAAGVFAQGNAAKDIFTVIHSRKSVRHFTGKPVAKADLEKIVRAGMAAPSAHNMQPWEFVVVTDRKQLDVLGAAQQSAGIFARAGAAIAVCVDPSKAADGNWDWSLMDASMAGENILLSIEALGLGGVWTAAYPDGKRLERVRAALGLPEKIIALGVIAVGDPTGEDKPKNKFKPGKIHWDRW